MEEQPSNETVQNNGNEQAPQVPAPKNSVISDAAQKVGEDTAQKQIENLEDRIKSAEKWMIGLTGAIALFALGSVIVGFLQWSAINSGSTDTHNLAIAAQTQARKLSDMSTAADQIRQAAQDMASNEKRLADDTDKSLKASNAQSAKVLNANIAASRLDQRAWVGIIQAALDPNIPIKGDTDTVAQVAIKNTGKTPALNSKTTIHWNILAPNGPLFASGGSSFFRSTTVFFPDASFVLSTNKFKIPAIAIPSITDGTLVFNIWGEITYDDVFGRPHWTHFCLILGTDLHTLNACSKYNGTDDEEKAN